VFAGLVRGCRAVFGFRGLRSRAEGVAGPGLAVLEAAAAAV